MSVFGRRVPGGAVAVLAAVIVLTAAVLLPAMTEPAARDVRLVAKNMAFYVEGDWDHPNPTIDVRPGERVRVTFRNSDRGIVHDFAVPATDTATKLLKTEQEDSVVFQVPSTPGTYPYACRPHQLMMSGLIRVVAR